MHNNKLSLSKRIAIPIIIIGTVWLILTLWVEWDGVARSSHTPGIPGAKKVLILYDPDPIYNLDEQVCAGAASGLSGKGIDVTIATVAAVRNLRPGDYDAYVLCANTYNWYPDWSMTDLVRIGNFIGNKPVIALVVGSGSTENSKKVFENTIRDKGGKLVESRSLWLMRPNDEHKISEKNTEVARSIATKMGVDFAQYLTTK